MHPFEYQNKNPVCKIAKMILLEAGRFVQSGPLFLQLPMFMRYVHPAGQVPTEMPSCIHPCRPSSAKLALYGWRRLLQAFPDEVFIFRNELKGTLDYGAAGIRYGTVSRRVLLVESAPWYLGR
jgi:hypothetical protein